jgi:hypothetical protein
MNMECLNRRQLAASLAAAWAIPSHALAQNLPPALAVLMREGRYLPIYLAALKGGRDSGLPPSQVAAMVGDEKLALLHAADAAAALDTFDDVRAEPALGAIRRMATGRRVVILNESHSVSRHRTFLAAVARGLRKDGFTHLAAETFTNSPTSAPLVEALVAGSQVDARHGTYLMDPVFAEAVREALALGYRMTPYEQRRDQRSIGGIAEREQAQAENLLIQIRQNPQARFLVYVGFSHLREAPDEQGNRWFAERLAAMLGENPLTVTQASTGSFAPLASDSPLASQILEKLKPRSSVVVSRKGHIISAEHWAADLAVFHPEMPYRKGRPGWLVADPMRHPVRVRVPQTLTQPFLVQASHVTDASTAIPADQCIGSSAQRDYTLLLRRGAYRLQLETSDARHEIGRLEVR